MPALSAVALLLAQAGSPPAPSVPRDADVQARITEYLRPSVEAGDFSGFVLVARGEHVVAALPFGQANHEWQVPNTVHTRFRIASLTKTFTAAAISLLAERGALKYDDPLSRFLPDFPRAGEIRIDHLLLHRSGMPNPDYPSFSHRSVAPAELLKDLASRPLLFAPGADGRYSNGGYVVLAEVVSRAAGRPYEAFLEQEIFRPLGLSDTATDRADGILPGRASGYVPGPGSPPLRNVPVYDMSAMRGSGSLVSSAQDLHRWARAVHRDELFKRTALSYPYGWGVRRYFDRPAIEQSGSLDGFSSYLAVYPDDALYVVCLTNVTAGLNDRCGKAAAAIALGHEPEPPPVPPVAAAFDPAVLEKAPGVFAAEGVGSFSLSVSGGAVYVRWRTSLTPEYVLPVGPRRGFVRSDRSTLELDLAGGTVVAVRRGWGGDPVAFKRQP